MIRRLWSLTVYFLRSFVFSLTGVLYVVFAVAYWALFFPPGQGTPDVENYIILIGALGVAGTFLSVLGIAARANRAENYPLLVRLPSRVEYVTAVFLSGFSFTLLLQLLVALLALIGGPDFSGGRAWDILPLWVAPNILAAVMALHASDLVTKRWSRVTVYGVLAILLLLGTVSDFLTNRLADGLESASRIMFIQGLEGLADSVSQLAFAIRVEGVSWLGWITETIFWPFRAAATAVFQGYFTPTQALAPAIIILYATILFLLAADLFATKDLEFTE